MGREAASSSRTCTSIPHEHELECRHAFRSGLPRQSLRSTHRGTLAGNADGALSNRE